MGNIIKRNITMLRFLKEVFKCLSNKELLSINCFETAVNGLMDKTHVRLGVLLRNAVFAPKTTIPYVDRGESDANKIVFYNLFKEDERYMLADGEIIALSDKCTLDVDSINIERKEELAEVCEFYKKVYELLGSVRSIPLTGNLSLDYSLTGRCYYSLRDKSGNVSEIHEIDEMYKSYINKAFAIATIDYRHLDEIVQIKNEIEELWNSLSSDNQENKPDEPKGTLHEVKTIDLKSQEC